MTELHTPVALTEEEAMAGYRAVVSWLNDVFGEHLTAADHPVRQGEGDPSWYTGPVLVQDFSLWDEPTAWAVVWEGGVAEWSMYVPHGGTYQGVEGFRFLILPAQLPAGLGAEAFSPFAVSLYRAAC